MLINLQWFLNTPNVTFIQILHVLLTIINRIFLYIDVWKNSMPKLGEVIGGTKTNIYCTCIFIPLIQSLHQLHLNMEHVNKHQTTQDT